MKTLKVTYNTYAPLIYASSSGLGGGGPAYGVVTTPYPQAMLSEQFDYTDDEIAETDLHAIYVRWGTKQVAHLITPDTGKKIISLVDLHKIELLDKPD